MRIVLLVFSCAAVCCFSIATAESNKCGDDIQTWSSLKYRAPGADDFRPYVEILGRSAGSIYLRLVQQGSPSEYLKSENHGKTWRQVRTHFPTISTLNASQIMDPRKSGIAYNRKGGIYLRSTDGGQHWTRPKMVIGGLTQQEFLSARYGNSDLSLSVVWAGIDPNSSATIYASFEVTTPSATARIGTHEVPGLFVSRDGGDSWSLFTDQISASEAELTPLHPVLGASSANPNVMMGYSDLGLVRTSDSGKTWIPVGQRSEIQSLADIEGMKGAIAEFERSTGRKSNAPIASRDWRRLSVSQIEFDPNDARIVYLVTNKGLFRTTDGGDSWTRLAVGSMQLGDLDSMSINPKNPHEIFVATGQGLFRSTDAGCHFLKVLSDGVMPKVTLPGGN